MNIFLDTNVFFNDPFLRKGKNRILIKLAENEDVKLFINKTVYMEVLRAHRTYLEKELKNAHDAYKKISPFLIKDDQTFILEVKIDDLIDDFEAHFAKLHDEGQIEIIEYDSEVLEKIVELDMYQKEPFIKKREILNDKGEKISFNKKEIRDAIIWYSYQIYIEKNHLERCYFISNNTKEFGVPGSSKIVEEPYTLHQEIIGSTTPTAFKTVHDFLTYNDDKIKELYVQLLSDDLYEIIVEDLEQGLAEELILTYFTEEILSETQRILSNQQPENLHDDYFMGGYSEPSSIGNNITSIKLKDVDIYGDDITVAVDLFVEMPVDIYLYNPVHDDRSDKFQYQATDLIKVEESVVFLIPIDTGKELDVTNFWLRDYIKGNKPRNLDVKFVDLENIDHEDMFSEEAYGDRYDPYY